MKIQTSKFLQLELSKTLTCKSLSRDSLFSTYYSAFLSSFLILSLNSVSSMERACEMLSCEKKMFSSVFSSISL